MVPRRDLAFSVMVQGLGSLATVGTTALIASRFGPSGQGFWASYKSLLDLVSVAAAYGFPIGFPYLVNVRRISDVKLCRFALRYSATLVPAIAIILFVLWMGNIIQVASSTPRLEILLIAFSGAAVASQAMVRGLVLATASTAAFNVVSTAPPCILLAAVAVWPRQTAPSLMTVAAVAAVTALAASLAVWWSARNRSHQPHSPPMIGELLTLGGWNFVVAVGMAAIPATTFQILAFNGAAKAEIGWLSIAILVQGALLTPANMLGPVIYNAWTRESSVVRRQESYGELHRLAIAWSVSASLMAGLILHSASPWLAKHEFGPVVPLTLVLLVAVPAGYSSRLMANVLLAAGEARLYAASTIVRVMTVVGLLLAAGTPTPQSAVFALLAGECSALVVSAIAIVGSLNWTWRHVLAGRPARAGAAT